MLPFYILSKNPDITVKCVLADFKQMNTHQTYMSMNSKMDCKHDS